MDDSKCPVTIVIVDDQQLVRESLSALIDSDPTMRLVASVSECETAIRMLENAPPQVVLVESELGGNGAFACIGKLRSAWPAVRVILLLTYSCDRVIEEAQSLGVDGIVTRKEPFEELRRSVEAVVLGRGGCSPRVRARFGPQREGVRSGGDSGHPPHLTPRELEVLRLIANGCTVREAARELGLAAPTVDNHKTRLMSRLNLHSGVQLVRYAIREGIIDA